MSKVQLTEYAVKRLVSEHTSDLVPTSCPHVFCIRLPKHWRSNKSLPNQFRVVSLLNVPDGTPVSVKAGNENGPSAEVKNPITIMRANEGRFSDLRFLGRSGRGKSFNITIIIETTPPLVAVYARAIKITVDGPRIPRNKHSSLRMVKLQQQDRRIWIQNTKEVEYRVNKCSKPRNAAIKLNIDRSIVGINSATARDRMRLYRDQLATRRVRFSNSAFNPVTPVGKTPMSHHLHSPILVRGPVVEVTELEEQQPPSDKYPSSNETSRLFQGANTDNNILFSPFKSAYLLSSINKEYAKLVARQLPQRTSANSEYGLSTSLITPSRRSSISTFIVDNAARISGDLEDIPKPCSDSVACSCVSSTGLNGLQGVQKQAQMITHSGTHISPMSCNPMDLDQESLHVNRLQLCKFLSMQVKEQAEIQAMHPNESIRFMPPVACYRSALNGDTAAVTAMTSALPSARYSKLPHSTSYNHIGFSPDDSVFRNTLRIMLARLIQQSEETNEQLIKKCEAKPGATKLGAGKTAASPMIGIDRRPRQTASSAWSQSSILDVEKLLEANIHSVPFQRSGLSNTPCRAK